MPNSLTDLFMTTTSKNGGDGSPILTWPALPVIYQFTLDTPPLLRAAYERAMWRWEQATGLLLFRPIQVEDDLIHLMLSSQMFPDGEWNPEDDFIDYPSIGGMWSDPYARVMQRHRPNAGVTRGEARVDFNPHTGDVFTATVVADPRGFFAELCIACAHELGHVLGLAEHPWQRTTSVMGEANRGVVRPARFEAEAIKERYPNATQHAWPLPSVVT
jgi:hypothetical protein